MSGELIAGRKTKPMQLMSEVLWTENSSGWGQGWETKGPRLMKYNRRWPTCWRIQKANSFFFFFNIKWVRSASSTHKNDFKYFFSLLPATLWNYQAHTPEHDCVKWASPGASSWYLGSLLGSVLPAATISPVDLKGVGVAPILDHLLCVSSLELKHTAC